MNKLFRIRLIILPLLLIASFWAYAAVIYLKQFNFNDDQALEKWNRMVLNGQVKYTLMKYGRNGYVEALSEKACSALYYKLAFKLKDYPLLTWRWRVLKFPDRSNATTEKERDDYAARVYVIFPFLSFSSSKFMEYVWSEDLPVGTIQKSPEGDNIRIIVARSGKVEETQWVVENRDVYKDYLNAFGTKPTRSVGAIAIMCDADSTKTEAEALFDDIAIGNETELKRRNEGK